MIVAPARAGARGELLQGRLADVAGDDLALVLHRGRERQRLAAGAGRKIEHALAGLRRAQQRRDLRRLVLEFEGAAFEHGAAAEFGRAFAGRDADADAAKTASARRENPARAARQALRRAARFSVLTRRSTGARA